MTGEAGFVGMGIVSIVRAGVVATTSYLVMALLGLTWRLNIFLITFSRWLWCSMEVRFLGGWGVAGSDAMVGEVSKIVVCMLLSLLVGLFCRL